MKKLLSTLAGCVLLTATGWAQTPRELVKEGVDLYDAGHYEQALGKYRQALAADPGYDTAQAELALTYNALGRYAEARDACELLLRRDADVGATLYVTYGNSLDALGDFRAAEQAYRRGLRKHPASYALYYNLGVAQAGHRQLPAAIASLQQSAARNPAHASSHLSLGLLLLQEGRRVPGVLALGRFLVLEPASERAARYRPLLDQALTQGISQTGERSITVNIPAAALDRGKKDADSFGPEEMMVSLTAAQQLDDTKQALSAPEKLIDQFTSLCKVMGELREKDPHPTGFLHAYYVPYFVALQQKNFVPAFVYLTHRSQADAPAVQQWLAAHPQEVAAFQEWSKTYTWPPMQP